MQKKFKIFIIFVGCLFFRLLPLRAPNIEPIMASIMPTARKFGGLAAFSFGFLSIFIYDLLTHFGIWTWIAAFSYGLVGVGAYFYFQKYKSKISNFVIFSIFATILYDLITGVLFAPIFHQTILNALVMQIPFTILHLAGNLGFALTLTPVLNKWLVKEMAFKKANSLVDLKQV